MSLSCIVFDCDGVILESVDAKTMAFARICDEIDSRQTDAFIAYTTLHGGVSRFEKFSWLIRRVHDRDILEAESAAMGEKFLRYCHETVRNSPLVPGFEETAQHWLNRVPMYVASGAPHYELGEILQRRGLDKYFAGIYGTPPVKAALLLNAVRDAGAAPMDTVMIGDSKTDLDASLIVGTRFYGRGDYFKGKAYPWGNDLTGLNAFLESVAAEEKQG